jgi:hypothetical protein
MDIPRIQVPHEPTSLITPNSPTPAMANNLEQNLAVNADCMSIPTGQSSKIAIPSKRSYPFGKDVPRKKRKKESYVTVRVYKQRKDLEHTDEIECALMPDGGLDLVALSQELNVEGCQAGRCNVIQICDADYSHCLPKVLDARYSRPWFSKRNVLESGAIKLLKAKEDYLRVVTTDARWKLPRVS